MPWGAIAGAALGAIGSAYGAKKDRAERRSVRDDQFDVIARGIQALNNSGERALPYLQEMFSIIDNSEQRALAMTSPMAAQGYRAVSDMYRQGQGQLNQNLASRGLYNSTAAMNFQRGLGAQYARDAGQIDAMLAGMRGGIIQNAGSARMGVNQALANMELGLGQRRAQMLGNIQFGATGGAAEGYGALGGGIGEGLGGAFDAWRSWSSTRQKDKGIFNKWQAFSGGQTA